MVQEVEIRAQRIKNFFVSVWNGIKSFVSRVVSAIVNFFKTRWNNLKDNTIAAWNAIKNFIVRAVTSFVNNDQAWPHHHRHVLQGASRQGHQRSQALAGKLEDVRPERHGRPVARSSGEGEKGSREGERNRQQGRVTIKSALHIGSPSKVMIEVGKNITEGLAIGIERRGPQVTSAMSDIAGRAVLPASGFASPRLGSVGPSSNGPMTASLAPGAVVEVAKDGIVRLVKAEIRLDNLSAAQAVRFG